MGYKIELVLQKNKQNKKIIKKPNKTTQRKIILISKRKIFQPKKIFLLNVLYNQLENIYISLCLYDDTYIPVCCKVKSVGE